MGVVYRAFREPDGPMVALKFLRSELAADPTYRRRFAHEARAAKEIRHPNLVRLLEAGDVDGTYYLAVDFIEGRSLDERIRSAGPLPLAVLLRVIDDVAAGLDALHRGGIVHRDIKPSNIMLARAGHAALTDFGLAKGQGFSVLTAPGQVMGTLDYLAPELIRGRAATAASDIYAFGCVVYEAISGAPPFAGGSGFQVAAAHLANEPGDPCARRPDLAQALGRAVLPALAKEPLERPESAVAYARSLRRAAGG
jgi:serine/threonine protein kinase